MDPGPFIRGKFGLCSLIKRKSPQSFYCLSITFSFIISWNGKWFLLFNCKVKVPAFRYFISHFGSFFPQHDRARGKRNVFISWRKVYLMPKETIHCFVIFLPGGMSFYTHAILIFTMHMFCMVSYFLLDLHSIVGIRIFWLNMLQNTPVFTNAYSFFCHSVYMYTVFGGSWVLLLDPNWHYNLWLQSLSLISMWATVSGLYYLLPCKQLI